MPAIWNVGNVNAASNKKVSSKLTFEVGESFKGRIISKGEGNEVVIKLSDGWQFTAEIEGEVNPNDEGLVRFEVEDFEGGKIKLKIMPAGQTQQSSEGSIIGDFMEKAGMTKENLDILKAMVKYNLPLTKENITFVKSITAFNEKINSNPEEIDNFINKFIAGKGIEDGSTKGQQIKDVLNDFLKSFKTVTKEDILFFIENDIDINKENIDSYNKLFKSEGTIKEYFDNVLKSLKELDVDLTDSKTVVKSNEAFPIEKTIQASGEKSSLGNNELASKTYNSNSTDKGKVSMLSLLKSMVGSDVEVTKETIKEVLIDNKSKFTTSEFNDKFLKLNSLSEKELIEVVKTSLGNKDNITNSDIKALISNILGKAIDIPEAGLQKVKDIIAFQMDTEVVPVKEGAVETQKNVLKEGVNDIEVPQKGVPERETVTTTEKGVPERETVTTTAKGVNLEEDGKPATSEVNIKVAEREMKNSIAKEVLNLSSKDIIREDIKVKIENMKDVIKNIIAHTELKGEGMDKVMQFIKGNISDFKLLNSVNNEYYYLDVPLNSNGKEYPCKLIIKDSRKDNKRIDTTNVKLILAVKTLNLGTVDGYLKVNGANLNVNIKCDEEFVKVINKTKEKLLEGLKTLGFFTSITVTPKIAEISLTTCRGFFEERHDRAIDIKV
ncbi:MAG TPA: hypothetical protein VIK26_09460 [Clostridium sp.]